MFQDAKITIYLQLVLTLTTENVIAACPENCISCDEQETCTSCKTGHWDLDNKCQFTCPSNCIDNDCATNNGTCIACKPGFYGSHCQQNCGVCEGGICGSLSCTKGCVAEYYEYQDTVDTFCLPCSQKCRSCNNASVCNVCNSGFYLFKYIAFGKLKVVCVQCQGEADCSNVCDIQNCNQCQIQDDSSLLCVQCYDGYRYNGQICIPNESTCAQGCSADCDKNGICKGSCNEGWTGERCSDSCRQACRKCEKSNANICHECKDDYYTATCAAECNPLCIKEAGKQTCRQYDGYCIIGCGNTFWGHYCNQSCPDNCADDRGSSVCDRDNGTCTKGCVDGYWGDKCETTVPKISSLHSEAGTKMQTNVHATTTTTTEIPTCVHCHENTDTKTGFITGYISGVGTAIFVVIITAALYHLRRRYIVKKSKSFKEGNGTETPTYYNENATETREPPVQLIIDANNYESLSGNRNTEKVYSELESQAQQQSHSYYNLDTMK